MDMHVDEAGGQIPLVRTRGIVQFDRDDPTVLDRDPARSDPIVEDQATADRLCGLGRYRIAPTGIRSASSTAISVIAASGSRPSTSNCTSSA